VTEPIATRLKDGVVWPIGGQAEVDWINEGVDSSRRITGAIPPLFADYATVADFRTEEGLQRDLGSERRQDLAFVDVLHRHDGGRSWWIGYLDTGPADIVFRDAPKATLYHGWPYVFVLAGPDQAATWRPAPGVQPNWKSHELPEVMFPEDRSWLVSFLWDDDWACIGGPDALIDDVLSDPVLAPNARRVDPQQNATPPGRWPG